jgi:mRNA interferase MazF
LASMSDIRRGWVIDVDLEPTRGSETGKVRPCIVVTNDVYNERVPVIQVVPLTEWTAKKGKIGTNVRVEPSAVNGLRKISIADCLQARPIDQRQRLVAVRGELELEVLAEIDRALKVVFGLV